MSSVCRVSRLISACWHVDSYLYWSDGSFLCGRDALLHGTHVSGQCWLIADSRRDTTQQRRHLACQRSTRYSDTIVWEYYRALYKVFILRVTSSSVMSREQSAQKHQFVLSSALILKALTLHTLSSVSYHSMTHTHPSRITAIHTTFQQINTSSFYPNVSNIRAPYSGAETSDNISSPFYTLAILWPACKIL